MGKPEPSGRSLKKEAFERYTAARDAALKAAEEGLDVAKCYKFCRSAMKAVADKYLSNILREDRRSYSVSPVVLNES